MEHHNLIRNQNKRQSALRLEGGSIEMCKFHCQSSASMQNYANDIISLTVTSPPYWNSIDYDLHAKKGERTWYRKRQYDSFGKTIEEYLARISGVF